ncbi:hypothetical protein [Deinococcus sp.]|uniref:hypothetical protein n=1 Tax=Deinococcus sp. TaxID=47478 RepID=UPI0025D0C44C|nr:hypothetical protein [Deinococcus sp.]
MKTIQFRAAGLGLGLLLSVTACTSSTLPNAIDSAINKAELRLAAQLLMPLLSAATVQLAARDFSQPLLPVGTARLGNLSAQASAPQPLSCTTSALSESTDADKDRIPLKATASLSCAYDDNDDNNPTALSLSGSMTVADKDDGDAGSGLSSSAALSGSARTSYQGASATFSSKNDASAFLDPVAGKNGYNGALTFSSDSTGSGKVFGIGTDVTLRRALDTALGLLPDADQLGGVLSMKGTLVSRNDLKSTKSTIGLGGALHARQGECKSADSGSVVFKKGAVSLKATVVSCGRYDYQ